MKLITALSIFCFVASMSIASLSNAQDQPQVNCFAYLQADKRYWQDHLAISEKYQEIGEIATQLHNLHNETFFATSDLWGVDGREHEARAIEEAAKAKAEPLRRRLQLLREHKEAELLEAAAQHDDAYYNAYVYPAPGWEADVSGYDLDLVLIMAKAERQSSCPPYTH